MAKKKNMYDLVLKTIEELKIGDSKTIPIPANIQYFRKYLNEISSRHGKKFITKVVNEGKSLQVMRITYSNIHSKTAE